MNYCAINADVVNSRNLDRTELIKKMKLIVAGINEKFLNELAAEFIITSGDEIQGLLKRPLYSYQIVRELQRNMRPISLTCGVGIGSLSTEISDNPAEVYTGELDGEAYHRAREMINQTKEESQSVLYYFNHPACNLLNQLIKFVELTESLRTERQQQTVELYRRHKKQETVAGIMGIGQTTVSRNLKRSFYYEIEEVEENIFSYLGNL